MCAGSTPSLVLLAFHYPPMLGPASQRAASFAHHLPALGWDPVVVTVEGGLFHSDPAHRPPAVETIRTPAPEPSKLLHSIRRSGGRQPEDPQTISELEAGPALSRARRLVRDYLYVPDGQAMWIPFAAAALRRAVRARPGPTVLMSTSVPYSAHLAALLATRAEKVPWIAELRDPWSQIEDLIRPRSRTRKRIDAALESRVVDAASALVVTSERTREAMILAYPELSEEAIQVVRNGFEPVESPAPPPGPGDPLQLVQAGSVPAGVPLEPLLRGIDRVARRRPGRLRLRVLAAPEPWGRAARALGDPDWLELAGLVAPAAATRAVAAASANVLLRPGDEHRQFVAAKLMDYLGARRPIVGIVSPEGEMAALAKEYGDMRLVTRYDEESVARVVEELCEQHEQGMLNEPAVGRSAVKELTRASQARALEAVLSSLL